MRLSLKRFWRSLVAGAFFIAYGSLALAFAPVLALPFWPPKAFRAFIRWFYRVFVFCARLAGLFAVRISAADRKALAATRGAVIAMNHISLIDIVVILAHLPDSTAIAKPAVLQNPFLAIVAKRMFIVNDGDAHAIVSAAAEYLAKGVNVIVFPQGTRGGKSVRRGAAHFALAARAPLVPVRIDYDPPVLAKGQPWWDVGDRIVNISLAVRKIQTFSGPDTHANARALTSSIAAALEINY